MVKQKIVIKVTMEDAKKRAKALRTVVGLHGVTKAEVGGDHKDRIVVVGEGIDSVELTVLLRKKMGFAELVSVGPAEERKDDKKEDKSKSMVPVAWPYQHNVNFVPYQPYSYEVPNDYNQSCSIM